MKGSKSLCLASHNLSCSALWKKTSTGFQNLDQPQQLFEYSVHQVRIAIMAGGRTHVRGFKAQGLSMAAYAQSLPSCVVHTSANVREAELELQVQSLQQVIKDREEELLFQSQMFELQKEAAIADLAEDMEEVLQARDDEIAVLVDECSRLDAALQTIAGRLDTVNSPTVRKACRVFNLDCPKLLNQVPCNSEELCRRHYHQSGSYSASAVLCQAPSVTQSNVGVSPARPATAHITLVQRPGSATSPCSDLDRYEQQSKLLPYECDFLNSMHDDSLNLEGTLENVPDHDLGVIASGAGMKSQLLETQSKHLFHPIGASEWASGNSALLGRHMDETRKSGRGWRKPLQELNG
eukprot:jgi/Botrbrau1/17822/Bobra.0127s0067.1